MDEQLAPLLQEFESMRNTLANFVRVIKNQNARIETLENKLNGIPPVNKEQLLIDRFTASSMRNRTLSETPLAIAYAAHLYHVKQVPAIRISKCGLLSQSKLHGLVRWETQHLLDFCEINGVLDVYKHGLDEAKARELVPDYDKLQDYLNGNA